MNIDQTDLERNFREISDDELLSRCGSGNLTEIAQSVADAELVSRGMNFPMPTPSSECEIQYDIDFTTVAQTFIPTDAYLIAARLEAEGIPAIVADSNFVQANTLLAIAAGGVRVRVPVSFAAEAQKVIEALNRGDFALSDDDESYRE